MKRVGFLAFIFFAFLPELIAQNKIEKLATGENFFSESSYSSALPLYLDLINLDSSNADLNYKIGICYFNSRSQKRKSIYYFKNAILFAKTIYCDVANDQIDFCYNEHYDSFKTEQILETKNNDETVVPSTVFKLLGDAYLLTYQFDLAIECFKKFKISISDKFQNSCIIENLDEEIKMAQLGEKLKSLTIFPINFIGESRIEKNNFEYLNYAAGPFSKNRSFVSNLLLPAKFKNEKSASDDFFYETPVSSVDSISNFEFLQKKSLHSQISKDSINHKMSNEATVGTSPNGQYVLIYRIDNNKGNLYTTCLKENIWTDPEKINNTINIMGWEQDEYISADGGSLYFTSNRSGGYGNNDIYCCKKIQSKKWSKAINIGPSINTPYDETAPFVCPAGNVLYFSSNKIKKNGGYDIFKSSLSDSGIWSKPINVGYPVNTSIDEIANETSIETKKNDPSYSKQSKKEEKENYMITFFDEKKNTITILKGEVTDIFGNAIKDLKITVTDNATNEILGLYFPDKKTGYYSFILPPGRNNNITYEAKGYLFQSDQITISNGKDYYNTNIPVVLSPISKGARVVLNNIFFDKENNLLLPISLIELNKLYNLLTDNPNLFVEISDNIDPKNNEADIKKSGLYRVQAIVNYLTKNGIDKNRIINKVKTESKLNEKNKSNYMGLNSHEKHRSHRLELKITDIK